MRTLLCTLTLAFLCLLLAPQQARAQYYDYCSYGIAWGTSYTWQSGGVVYGYSSTELDYCAGLWYDPETFGLFSEGNPYSESNRTLVSAYTTGYADIDPADIYFWYSAPRHNEYYSTESIHYVREVYQYYTCFYGCGYYWYDPWGFGFAEGYGGPNWYGYGGAGYWYGRRRRLGNTIHTIQYRAFTCQPGQSFSETGEPCPTPTPTPTPPATPTPTPKVTVTEVGFKGDHKVKRFADDTTIDPSDNSPTWVRGRSNNKDFPVAYTKGTRPTIFATLVVEQASSQHPTATVRFKDDGLVMGQIQNVSVGSNGAVSLSNVPLSTDPRDFTRVKMSLYTYDWEISFDGSSWVSIGSSGPHEVHWLFANPIEPAFQNPESAPTPTRTYTGLYDQALWHATAKTVDGLTDVNEIAAKITEGVPADLIYDPGRRSQNRHPLAIYVDLDTGQQCSDNVALLRGLLRSIGIGSTTNYFWGGDPSSGTERSHWFVEPGTSAVVRPGFPRGGTVTSQYPRPAIDAVPANPYFTFHSTLRVGTGKSYDPSYGVVEDEVSLIKAVDASGTCLSGPAANTARIISTNLSNLNTGNLIDFGHACGTTASVPRSATVVSQSVPAFMDAGGVYAVSVTLQNNGSATWTQSDLYRLGSQNPQDNYTWGLARVELPSSVPPGGQVTFDFYVTAPSYPGTYNFQWRMVHDGVEWFGDYTPNIPIEVYAVYSCDWWQEQNCWDRGGWWDSSTCQCYGGYYPY